MHKHIKEFYSGLNKKAVEGQFAKQERRKTHVRQQLDHEKLALEEVEEIKSMDDSPLLHHFMADNPRSDNVFSLPCFLQEHQGDPAVKVSDH